MNCPKCGIEVFVGRRFDGTSVILDQLAVAYHMGGMLTKGVYEVEQDAVAHVPHEYVCRVGK